MIMMIVIKYSFVILLSSIYLKIIGGRPRGQPLRQMLVCAVAENQAKSHLKCLRTLSWRKKSAEFSRK